MNSINTSQFKQFDPDLGLRQSNLTNESTGISAPNAAAESKGSTFLDALQNSMDEVNQNQLQADQSVKDLIAGRTKNLHETMLQLQKADLSLKTMMQVRNKILEAYKEIMKMQV
jgi:flagellar hook-basal body complex protein FliE